MVQPNDSRREFVKKAAYIAPAILTLQAFPAYVKAGSGKGPPFEPGGPPEVIPPGRPIVPPGQK